MKKYAALAIYLIGAIMLVVGVFLFVYGYNIWSTENLYATLGNIAPGYNTTVSAAANLEGVGSIMATIGFILFISGIVWKPKL